MIIAQRVAVIVGTVIALAGAGGIAHATPLSVTGVCPATAGLGPFGGGGVGNATDCNLLITFNADGSITTEFGPQTTYDNVEDALIGVVNNTSNPITSFNISGTGIFGFDGDGVDGYLGIANLAAALQPAHGTGAVLYGGRDAYFTDFVGNNSGTVNFLNPIAPGGGRDFFSLEEPISVAAPPIIAPPVGATVPEPGSLALLGLGLAGFVARRRVTRKK